MATIRSGRSAAPHSMPNTVGIRGPVISRLMACGMIGEPARGWACPNWRLIGNKGTVVEVVVSACGDTRLRPKGANEWQPRCRHMFCEVDRPDGREPEDAVIVYTSDAFDTAFHGPSKCAQYLAQFEMSQAGVGLCIMRCVANGVARK